MMCKRERKSRVLWGVLLAVGLLIAAGCGKTPAPTPQPSQSAEADKPDTLGQLEVRFDFLVQDKMPSNQVAVWIEDANGKFINTVYVTRFTAAGGYMKDPNALPIWVEKARWDSSDIELVHAVSQATPGQQGPLTVIWDGTDHEGSPVPAGSYAYLLETNLDGSNRALWRGTFTVGDTENSSEAEAAYLPDTAQELDATVEAVRGVFTPAG